MRDWPRQALGRIEGGGIAAMVTVLAIDGSTPREAGAKMLVWLTGQAGTIGGGNLEHQATAQARRMLALDEGRRFAIQDYPLGPLLSQCCGGRVRLLIERIDQADAGWLAKAERYRLADRPFEVRRRLTQAGLSRSVTGSSAHTAGLTVNDQPARARDPRPAAGDEIVEPSAPVPPRLLLFGAGHVGVAIAHVLEPLPFRVSWFDSRPQAGIEPGVRVAPPPALVEIASQGCDYMLILTHDHTLDYALVSAALAGPGDGYLGLIGSKTKRARFLSRLRAEGLPTTALERMVCPIGLPGLKSKAPEVIAVSVAADLLLRLETGRRTSVLETALAGL